MEENAINGRQPIPLPIDKTSSKDWFEAYDNLVKTLRHHCPWDREQTHDSISYLLIEECYETIEAIKSKNDDELAKELGDMLLHVVMHAYMAEQRGAFNIMDVMKKSHEKLVSRHPHVFGDVDITDADKVVQNWESLKMKEGQRSILQGVPQSAPALLRAQRMQEKASNIGFDWENKADVWKKVEEELAEFKAELQKNDTEKAFEEFGDLMFALVNVSRFENIIAEDALQHTNEKFIRRFKYIEERAKEAGKKLRDMTLGEMDEIWELAKKEV
jgi:MazG family protein